MKIGCFWHIYNATACIPGTQKRLSTSVLRWIIKTTTNIFFDIMRKHNQSKAWLEKLMDYNNAMYTQSLYKKLCECLSAFLYIRDEFFVSSNSCFISCERKNYCQHHMQNNNTTVNATTSYVNIHTQFYTFFRGHDEREEIGASSDWAKKLEYNWIEIKGKHEKLATNRYFRYKNRRLIQK